MTVDVIDLLLGYHCHPTHTLKLRYFLLDKSTPFHRFPIFHCKQTLRFLSCHDQNGFIAMRCVRSYALNLLNQAGQDEKFSGRRDEAVVR